MPCHPPRPTLLIFTLGPSREGMRRRLLPARSAPFGREIHRHCLDEALAAGRACGARLVVSAPARLDLPPDVEQVGQRGRGFGRRLIHAIRDAGGGPLLVIGTDTPGLEPGHVEHCLERLARDPSEVAVGPSPDGGFYLLAFDGALERELGRVRWCRRDTRRSLLDALAASGRPVTLLPALRDLDRRADLERWLAGRTAAGGAWALLARRLAELLAALRRPPILAPALVPRPARARTTGVRGPPA